MTENDFTHFDESGRARMVNVGDKEITKRTAIAEGRVLLNPQTFELVKSGGMKKGDVLATAQIAGIMGAKRTPDLIPMCHPLFLSGIKLDLTLNEEDHAVQIRAQVSCEGHRAYLAPLSLRRAMLAVIGQTSMPMKRRFSRRAASSAVPLPAKGSSTQSPSLDAHLTMRSKSSRGFCTS